MHRIAMLICLDYCLSRWGRTNNSVPPRWHRSSFSLSQRSGKKFLTSWETIMHAGNSMLASMFRGKFSCTTDEDGFAFIDRDGELLLGLAMHAIAQVWFAHVPSCQMGVHLIRSNQLRGSNAISTS